jgi:hypothetical protein
MVMKDGFQKVTVYSGFSQSASLSSPGDWVSADYFDIPYVVDYSGYALYDSPW